MDMIEARNMCMTHLDVMPTKNRCTGCDHKLTKQTGCVKVSSGYYCQLCWDSPAMWIPEKFDSYSYQIDLSGHIVDMFCRRNNETGGN